jgi:type VI protein secretion system component VasF
MRHRDGGNGGVATSLGKGRRVPVWCQQFGLAAVFAVSIFGMHLDRWMEAELVVLQKGLDSSHCIQW